MRSAPSMVVFDLDDTFYAYAPCDEAGRAALVRYASTELGIRDTGIRERFAEARDRVKRRLGNVASSHSRLLYCHEFLELMGLRSDPLVALSMEQEYWRNYLMAAKLRRGAIELLQVLRYNDVSTAIVTDLTAQIQFRKLTHFDLSKHIDHVVCSEETPEEKSSLDPFKLLFERTAPTKARSVWFVGDRDIDAPVSALVELSLISEGTGFVREESPDEHHTRWREFSEIERVVEKTFAAAAGPRSETVATR